MKRRLYITGASFVGGRKENQDCYMIDEVYEPASPGNISITRGDVLKLKKELIFAISDGMGGGTKGREASRKVIGALTKFRRAVGRKDKLWLKINKAVLRMARENPGYTGATASVCKVINGKDNVRAEFYTIGDSPVYYYSAESRKVELVNILDNEAGLSEEELSEEEKKKKSRFLCHFFGNNYGGRIPPIHKYSYLFNPGDVIVIGSDGLCSLSEEEIKAIITSPKYTSLALSLAVGAVEKAGIKADNTTAVVIEFN